MVVYLSAILGYLLYLRTPDKEKEEMTAEEDREKGMKKEIASHLL